MRKEKDECLIGLKAKLKRFQEVYRDLENKTPKDFEDYVGIEREISNVRYHIDITKERIAGRYSTGREIYAEVSHI